MSQVMDKFKEKLLMLEELQIEVLKQHYGNSKIESRNDGLSKRELDRFSEGLETLLETFIHSPGQKDFNYLKDAPSRSAYILYYLMPNVQRWIHMLDASRYNVDKTSTEPIRLMDFGAGPGSSALGFLMHLGENFTRPIEVELVDWNSSILKDARFLIENFGRSLGLNITVNIQNKMDANKPIDMVLMGNVWNESLSSHENARNKQIQAWMSHHKDKIHAETDILILEPANRRSSRLLMGMRDYFAKNKSDGFKILAPCPSGLDGKECVLNHQKGRPWCHFGFNSCLLPLFDRCMPLSGFQNDRLSYSYLILTKKKVESVVGRVISNKMKIDEDFGCYICHQKGRLTLGPYRNEAVPLCGSTVKKNLIIFDSSGEKRALFEEPKKPEAKPVIAKNKKRDSIKQVNQKESSKIEKKKKLDHKNLKNPDLKKTDSKKADAKEKKPKGKPPEKPKDKKNSYNWDKFKKNRDKKY